MMFMLKVELQSAEISRLRKNIMGTLSFDLKVGSMRKAQDFIVYPMSELEDKISIQSSKKFGIISIEDGREFCLKEVEIHLCTYAEIWLCEM